MKAVLKKKARIVLMAGSFLLAAVLALTGVLIYFKLGKEEKKILNIPEEILNPLDFSVDAWDGSTASSAEFNQNFASRGEQTFTIDYRR